jgi:hypothetical protein
MYFLQNFIIQDALSLRELEREGFLALMGSLVGKYEYKACSRGRGRSDLFARKRELEKERKLSRSFEDRKRESGGGGRAVRLEAFRGMKTFEFCFRNSVPLRIEFMWSFHTDDVVSPSCKEERDYRFLYQFYQFFLPTVIPSIKVPFYIYRTPK